MNINRARLIIISTFVVLLSFSAGYLMGVSGYIVSSKSGAVTINRQVPEDRKVDFALFWSVWDTLESKYVDQSKVVPANMVYGAIKGMVAAVGDPYTAFLIPSENQITQQDLQGNFDGVGIQIGYKGTQLAVIAPLPNTPAERAGVQAGDYIIGIKDEQKKIETSTSGMNLPRAVEIIRGSRGSRVTLTLLREGQGEPITVDLERASIEVPSVVVSYVGEGEKIAHLKLLKFGGDTKNEWDKMVNEINGKPGVDQIVLDLRNNPGGYLQASVDIVGDFVELGSVVVIEEEGNGKKTEFKTTAAPRLENYEVVILVNEGSASASEILAGALRDISKVKLIGENTFGKGTVQEPLQLEGGSGLHITIAKWLTPSGKWINETGLEPDMVVEDKSDTPQDEQLDSAISLLQS